MSILSKLIGFFTSKPVASLEPQAVAQSRKTVTAHRRRARAAKIHARSMYPWMDLQVASIKRPGQYIITTPKDVVATLDIDRAQTSLCNRLGHRFGNGKYSTRRIHETNGGLSFAVYIL